jgi:hypothetical protein
MELEPITEEQVANLITADNDSLAQSLSEYRTALGQEFADSSEDAKITAVKATFTKLLEDAAASIESLMKGADSESVQLSAAKFVFQVVMGKKLAEGTSDPMDKLISELTSKAQ